jgi:uncharacterized membrane protein
MNMEQPKKIIASSLLIVIFVLVVSLTSWYVQIQIESGTVCSCAIPLPILIPIIASIGLLIGTVVYYMFSPRFEKKQIDKNSVLKLLDNTEQKVMNVIIDNKGEISQARIVSLTRMPKVKVFRSLEKLRVKGIIEKENLGKTNRIKLNEEMSKIFY